MPTDDTIPLTAEEIRLIELALLDASIGYSRKELFYGPDGKYPDDARETESRQDKLKCRKLARRLAPYAARLTVDGLVDPQNSAQFAITERRISSKSSRA